MIEQSGTIGSHTRGSRDNDWPTYQVAVIIATAGRPAAAQDPIDAIAAMTPYLHAEGVVLKGIVSAPTPEDVSDLALPDNWRMLFGARGLAAQRNTALDSLRDETDVAFFFDDDAIPREDYISTALKTFRDHPEVVALTGQVIIDGAPQGREVSAQEARVLLEQSFASIPRGRIGKADVTWQELYGCNFAIRCSALSTQRFDSKLPLYSWLEDLDYARRAIRVGPLAALHD
ncbi:glycosyltransferase family 2 protein [Propionibacterium sp.]|uniref:glycosyltransferase family 2 protein n=1 Tax=Propionibacterium sp. TaxID=1977903 RepID=UPI0039E80E3F